MVADGAAVDTLDCVFLLSVEVKDGVALAAAADPTARKDLGSRARAHANFSAWISCAVEGNRVHMESGTFGVGSVGG